MFLSRRCRYYLSVGLAFSGSQILSLPMAMAQEKLPANLKWESNNTDPQYGAPEAKRGGIFHDYLTSFPLTLRTVGPDANDSFAEYSAKMFLPLVARHPNTQHILPMLANEWAYSADKKTMYFRINKNAKWSDGKPVTADDAIFTAKMMRMSEIQDPFQNDFFKEEIDKVTKFDDYTIGITEKKAMPELDLYLSLNLMPKHYFDGKIDKGFVQKFNWDKNVPVTGPYVFDKIEKGKLVTLKRIKNWWGNDERYFAHRFNADEIQLKVIRDDEVAFESFRKGDLDKYWAVRPVTWHDKCKGEIWDKGYVEKIWAYNSYPQGPAGFWLNVENELLKDENVRFAFAHALNFKLVISKLLYGDYERLNSFFDGFGPYSNPNVKAREYSIEKVKYYLEKSGWKRGEGGIYEKNGAKLSLEILTDTSPQLIKRLEVLREEAKKAGIEMNIKALDSSLMFKTSLEKKHQVAYISMTTGIRPSPWEYFHSDNSKPQTNNFFMVKDAELDKLTKAFRESLSVKEQQEYSRKIIQKVHDLGIFIPMFKVPFVRETAWRWWRLPKIPGTAMSTLYLYSQTEPVTGGISWFDEVKYKETQEAMKSGKTFNAVVVKDTTYKN